MILLDACGDKCGTITGDSRHRKAGEPPCGPCWNGAREYHRVHKARRRSERVVKAFPPGTCQGCGVSLADKRSRNPAKYCSDSCRMAVAIYGSRPAPRKCMNCGATFNGRRGAKYCSYECSWRYNTRKRSMEAAVKRVSWAVTCEWCGVVWQPKPNNQARARFCSTQCHTRAATRRYKARLRDAFVEDVSPLRVADRDDWRCGLCAALIDPDVKPPDPRCLSIDHIVPISQGGEHSYRNVRAAHKICNSRRGNEPFGVLFGWMPDELPEDLPFRLLPPPKGVAERVVTHQGEVLRHVS